MLIHMENDPNYIEINRYLKENTLPDGINSQDVLYPENP